MKILKKSLTIIAFCAAVSKTDIGFSEETSFTLQIPLFSVTSTSTDAGGETVSSSETSISSAGTYGWIAYGNWLLYLDPFTPADSVGLSYMVTPELEVGGFLGFSTGEATVGETTGDLTSYTLAPFATYYLTLANSLILEAGLTITSASSKVEADGSTLSETSSLGFFLLFSAVYSITEKLGGVGFLSFDSTSMTTTVASVDTDTDYTSVSAGLALRYTL